MHTCKCNSITFLLSALAMDPAMLVLPTPGGPVKHRIFPCTLSFKWLTAMNSCKVHGTDRFVKKWTLLSESETIILHAHGVSKSERGHDLRLLLIYNIHMHKGIGRYKIRQTPLNFESPDLLSSFFQYQFLIPVHTTSQSHVLSWSPVFDPWYLSGHSGPPPAPASPRQGQSSPYLCVPKVGWSASQGSCE